MKEIIVKSQSEFDALPKTYLEATRILIQSPADVWLQVNTKIENQYVEAWGSSHVVARGSSHVVAWGSSHVVAWGSSHVVARGSSHVEAWGSSHVEAWGSSHVEARGSSHVVARGSVSISCQSDCSSLILFGFVVAMMVKKAKSCVKKSKTCTVITPKTPEGNKGWLESQGAESKSGSVILFKRVSKDWKTQEGNPNETVWAVGAKLDHQKWNPIAQECGEGKYHACSRPFFCDEFRSEVGDVYIAIKIQVKHLHACSNPKYPHKIAFKSGVVLYQCDRYGVKI